MSEYNKESIDVIVDNIIDIMKCCLEHKDTWHNNKTEMLQIIEKRNKYFHDNYYRITKTLVDYDNIDPMISMLRQFHKVQTEKMDFSDCTKIINDSLNATYVDPILDSDKLKKEREIKMSREKK
jgi:hypothetical protein